MRNIQDDVLHLRCTDSALVGDIELSVGAGRTVLSTSTYKRFPDEKVFIRWSIHFLPSSAQLTSSLQTHTIAQVL